MSRIKILDDTTVSQIAAGEVIENPASIIKELVENSIDAMATNITVEIRNGGRVYIRVTDNGVGFSKEDLPLAFLRHSTSKLEKIEDLYGIFTMGFRGEALASIGAVADVTCISREENNPHGYRYRFSFGEPKALEDYATNQGSTLIVENLFANLPVRKNFLKSDTQEAAIVQQLVTSFALSHSSIGFTFIKDGRVLLKTAPNERLRDRIYQVLGQEVAKNLWFVEDEASGIQGYISNNLLYRSTRMHQYITINRRMVKFPELVKGIERKYRSIIPLQKYPLFILHLHLPQSAVDVNVHPNKTVVQISDLQRHLGQWEQIIGRVLRSSMEVPTFGQESKDMPKKTIFDTYEIKKTPAITGEPSTIWDTAMTHSSPDVMQEKTPIIHEIIEKSPQLKECHREYQPSKQDTLRHEAELIPHTHQHSCDDTIDDSLIPVSEMTFIGQLFGTYLLFEGEEKLLIVDQHAAHERITYEMYLKNTKEQSVHRQTLMVPLMIPYGITPIKADDPLLTRLGDIGFDATLFDDMTIAIRSVPILWGEPLSRGDAHAIIQEVLHTVPAEGNRSITLDEFFIERIMKKACVKAVKAGQKFDAPAAIDLLTRLRTADDPLTCPHGRPTLLIQTKKDFDQSFLREMS